MSSGAVALIPHPPGGGGGGGGGGGSTQTVDGYLTVSKYLFDTSSGTGSWIFFTPSGVDVEIWFYYNVGGGEGAWNVICTTTNTEGYFSASLPSGETPEQFRSSVDGQLYYLKVVISPYEGDCYYPGAILDPYFEEDYYTNTFTGLNIFDTSQMPVPTLAGLAYFDDPGVVGSNGQWESEGNIQVQTGSSIQSSFSLTAGVSYGIASGSVGTSNSIQQSWTFQATSPSGANCVDAVASSPYSTGSCSVGLELGDWMWSYFDYFTADSSICPSGDCSYVLENYVHGTGNSTSPYYWETSAPEQADPLSPNDPGSGNVYCANTLIAQASDTSVGCGASVTDQSSITTTLGLSVQVPVPFGGGSSMTFSISGSVTTQVSSTSGWTVNVNNPTESGCIDFEVFQASNGVAHVWPTGTSCNA